MNQQRDQIILEMCRAYRSDYDLKKLPSDPSWLLGLTDLERQGLWRTMAHVYDTEIAPRIKNETHIDSKHKNRLKRKMGKHPRRGICD